MALPCGRRRCVRHVLALTAGERGSAGASASGIDLTSGDASAGAPGRLRAVVRATDFVTSGSTVSVPAITARVIDERGAQEAIRLWPTAALGVFEGDIPASAAGRYDVRVETGGGVSADMPLIVSPAADASRAPGDPELAATVAAATGGVVVTSDRLQALIDRLGVRLA